MDGLIKIFTEGNKNTILKGFYGGRKNVYKNYG